jgi:electron transfer flavoprotein alpha subunit
MVLALLELQDGAVARASWEAVAAAQAMADGAPVGLVVLGHDVETVAQEVASRGIGRVHVVDAPELGAYTPDAYLHALDVVMTALTPSIVVLAHTYRARDFAPALAARLGAPLMADVIGVTSDGATRRFKRPMFQGKLTAEVEAVGEGPVLVSVQIGAFRADAIRADTIGTDTVRLPVDFSGFVNRQQVEPPFREARQAVDLGQAERIVAVGRGIKGKEHIALAQALADAIGGEVAASRPICDSGWMPMDRQIGSSGQTVAPKLYVALGISGAIQHLVGMKGSRVVVAINKDADAPIFEVADYGVVADLFEVVPALTAALQKRSAR